MPIVIKKGGKPLKLDLVETEKSRKHFVPPTVEQVSQREPLEVAIIIAQTLARQAARRDHEAAIACLASTHA